MRGLERINYIRIGFELQAINIWEDVDEVQCEDDELCVFGTGKDILKFYGFDADRRFWYYVTMVAQIIVLRTAAFLIIDKKARSYF